MIFERVPLSPDWPEAWLDAYVVDNKKVCNGLLVIPGGGYKQVCTDREGEPIALAFQGQGINCFVLHYTVAPNAVFPQQLIEAALAMKHIKTNADRYHVDPDRIFAVGFSAGGHLTGSLGTLWHIPAVAEALNGQTELAKPKGMLLCYAVLSGHAGSFYNLLGTQEPTEAQLAQVKLDRHVDANTVPAFFMHTTDDPIVPVKNALNMAAALSAQGIPYEMHIYPHGPHGMALANEVTAGGQDRFVDSAIAQWVPQAAYWMKHLA